MNCPRPTQLGPDPPARWVGTVVSLVDGLSNDLPSRAVLRGGAPLRLTPISHALLRGFVQ